MTHTDRWGGIGRVKLNVARPAGIAERLLTYESASQATPSSGRRPAA